MLQKSNPDSAIIIYQKAILCLEGMPKNERVRHQLAITYLDLSNLYISKGDYDKQKEYARKAQATAHPDDKEASALGLLYEGIVSYRQGIWDSALSLYCKADSLAKQAGTKALEAKILSNIANITYQQGNIEEAIADFAKAEDIGIELNDQQIIAGSHFNMGIIYTDSRDFDKAKDAYAKAIEYYARDYKEDDLAACYKNLGNVYFWEENYAEALKYYQQSSELALKLGSKQEIAKTYNNMGEVYRTIGDLDQALEMYFNSLDIKMEISDKAGMATTYRALASTYYSQQNQSKSLEYFQRALEIDSTLNHVENMGIEYANISTLYSESNQNEKALGYVLKSIELFKQAGNAWGESESYQLLGSIYQDMERYDSALEYFQKSLEHKMNLSSDGQGIAEAYLFLSNFYLKKPGSNTHDVAQAERYALSAYQIADSLELPLLKAKISGELANVYERQGNYKQAARFLKINKQANDTLFSRSKAEALVFAEARWNDEKRQGQILLLEEKNQSILMQKEEQHKRHQLLLYGLILIFLFIVLTALLLWKYKHKQREIRLQRQLAHIAVLRLQSIQNRISPHFMFNVLNAVIPALRKHEELIRPLKLLVQSIRGSLQASGKIAIPLEEEISIVKNYIELHESIQPGAIHIKWNIENNVDKQLLLPFMMMQIPIENAIKYAFDAENKNKSIVIHIEQNTQSVNITIEDNGIGYNPGKFSSDPRSTGNGLNILFKTVDLLNAKNQHSLKFDIQNLSEIPSMSGTKVNISIPLDYKYSI